MRQVAPVLLKNSVVVLTNADHDVFIDREDDVLREMRMFLSK